MADTNTGAAAPQDERDQFEALYTAAALSAGVDFQTPVKAHRKGEGYGTATHLDGCWHGWKMARAALPARAVARCPTCDDTGLLRVGTSGREADGNAPVTEPCPECEYGEPAATAADEKPFMYGIASPDGKPYFDELCVSGDRGDLQEMVDSLNDGAAPDSKYTEVALYTRPAPVQAVAPSDARLRKLVDTYFTNNVGENVYNQMIAARAELAAPAAPQAVPHAQPMFWYRPRSDGGFDGPLHNDHIEAIRKWSGAWVPLFPTAQPAAQPADAQGDPIRQLIELHAELLEGSDYVYFELARTRQTDWVAWLCSHPAETHPDRKVLAKGQGSTPDEACRDALKDHAARLFARTQEGAAS